MLEAISNVIGAIFMIALLLVFFAVCCIPGLALHWGLTRVWKVASILRAIVLAGIHATFCAPVVLSAFHAVFIVPWIFALPSPGSNAPGASLPAIMISAGIVFTLSLVSSICRQRRSTRVNSPGELSR